MTKDQMFARVLQLRADGLSFRAIEGKMLKAFGMKEVGKGYRAFNLLKQAKAAKKAAGKKTAKAAPVKAVKAKAVTVAKTNGSNGTKKNGNGNGGTKAVA